MTSAMPEEYLPEDHPAYPAAEQIIGCPVDPTGQGVVGHILGRGVGPSVVSSSPTPARDAWESVGLNQPFIPKMWQMTYDTHLAEFRGFNGFHLFNRVYFYYSDGFPNWHNQSSTSQTPHHYTLTPPTDFAATYWQTVYRKVDGIDNLEQLHAGGRHPVVDKAWYLQFIRTGWLTNNAPEPNSNEPAIGVPENSWVLFSFDWSVREHRHVFVHPSWNPAFYNQRFDPVGKNDFLPYWPEDLIETHPPITIEPFYP